MRDRLENGERTASRAAWAPRILAVAMVAASLPAAAQEPPSGGEVFSEFLACEAVPDPTEQLICFRAALKKYKARFGLLSGRVEDAARENPAALPRSERMAEKRSAGSDKTITGDRPQSHASRSGDTPGERVGGTIIRARKDVYGYWILTLDNGQVWKEASGLRLPDNVDLAGRRATIEKSAVGSRWISIEGVRGKARVVPVR